MYVGVHEAKTTLSRLLLRVEAGEDVVLTRSGRPVARLVRMPPRPPRKPGRWAGRVRIAENFDAPLPKQDLDLWDGAPE